MQEESIEHQQAELALLGEQYVEGKKKSGMATCKQHLPFDGRDLLEKQ